MPRLNADGRADLDATRTYLKAALRSCPRAAQIALSLEIMLNSYIRAIDAEIGEGPDELVPAGGVCRAAYRPSDGWHGPAEAVVDFDAQLDSEMPYIKADGEPSEKELAHETVFQGADAAEFGGPLS